MFNFFVILFIAWCALMGFLYVESYPWISGWHLGIGYITMLNVLFRAIYAR